MSVIYNPPPEIEGDESQCDSCDGIFLKNELHRNKDKEYCSECRQSFIDDGQYEKVMQVYTEENFSVEAIYL